MKFELLGQFKGAECKLVMEHAIALRKRLEPWFRDFHTNSLRGLAIVLRVDGSLGSFGKPGVENIEINSGIVECDLVIEDMDWINRTNDEIKSTVRCHVIDAISRCFEFSQNPLSRYELDTIQAHAG